MQNTQNTKPKNPTIELLALPVGREKNKNKKNVYQEIRCRYNFRLYTKY